VKALVVGGGSIGTRHLKNLGTLGVTERAFVEPNPARRETVMQETGVPGLETFEQGLDWGPDLAVIATPSNLHVAQATAAAEARVHLFVEKPLSHDAEGLGTLVQVVQAQKLTTLVGCNMRFHPGPAQVKALLDAGAVGDVLFARIQTGSYLPAWRPWQDYRQSYSANASMGGGCLLDCIHEIDLARWYLGGMTRVFCLAGKRSPLELDVEDVAALTCEHEGGAFSEIHLDYVQRTYERGCQIAGTTGSIFWDFRAATVRWYEAAEDRWTTFEQPDAWEINDMYLAETRHFLDCIRDGTPTTLPVEDAVGVMQAVFAAKRSAASRRMEDVNA
jgi:predicted dehydrogenase